MPSYEFIILGAMAFSFSSPFEQYFDHDVTIKQVDVPTQTGAVGILPIHVPTLGCLAPGTTLFSFWFNKKSFQVRPQEVVQQNQMNPNAN